MKTFLRFVFHSLYTLFFLVLGIVLLDLYFEYFISQETVTEQINIFMENSLYIIIASAFFILVPMLYFLLNLSCRRKESFLKYTTPEGEILISVYAIEDFIKKTSRNFREIKEAYPKITLKGKDSIEVKIKLKIWAGIQNLPLTIEEIQKDMRSQIQNMLGIENIAGIHIFLSKDSFASRDIPSRKRKPISGTSPIIRPTETVDETESQSTDEDFLE